MKAYFISDNHNGSGKANDGKGKEDELCCLCQRVVKEKASLYHLGDLWELWGTSWKRIWAEPDNQRVFAALCDALTATVPGNHDRKLPEINAYIADYLHYGHSIMVDLDGEPAWLEHGHAFDPSWQRGFAVKLGAKLLYAIEGKVWSGADEWLAAQLHHWQDEARKKANDKDAGRLPYWQGALQRSRFFPDCRTFVVGHTHHAGIERFPNDRGKVITYVNTGTWARDDQGRQRMDVTMYETGKGWWQGQAEELV